MSSLSTLPSNKPTTLKKLTEDHVKQIFSCIHNNTHPPESLMFQIVPVGLEGFKLSPPSYEFEGKLKNHVFRMWMDRFLCMWNLYTYFIYVLMETTMFFHYKRWTLCVAEARKF